jgi:hypothetical protein
LGWNGLEDICGKEIAKIEGIGRKVGRLREKRTNVLTLGKVGLS